MLELRLLRLGELRLLRCLRELRLRLLRVLILGLGVWLILVERNLSMLTEGRLLLLVWVVDHRLLLQLL